MLGIFVFFSSVLMAASMIYESSGKPWPLPDKNDVESASGAKKECQSTVHNLETEYFGSTGEVELKLEEIKEVEKIIQNPDEEFSSHKCYRARYYLNKFTQ